MTSSQELFTINALYGLGKGRAYSTLKEYRKYCLFWNDPSTEHLWNVTFPFSILLYGRIVWPCFCISPMSTVIHVLQKQNVEPSSLSYPKRMNGFGELFLHLKTLVYFLNLNFESLGPLNRELNVSSRHDMHGWHWPPKHRDSRNCVCVLKEGGYSSDIW